MVEEATADRAVGFKRRKLLWCLLLFVVAAALATIFTPVWLIMPFKAQTARGVAISYLLKSWSPVVTTVALVAALALSAVLWRGARWWARTALVIILIPAFVWAWFARQNHFEWMFNPLPNPAYARGDQADFIGDGDMVLSVVINGEASAYSVRQMAYHHVVQDTVGGVPIVATY
jgi:hypothetical protein